MPDKEKKGLAPTSKLMNQIVPPPGVGADKYNIPFALGHETNKGSYYPLPNYEDTTSHHPADMREGVMEKLIKYYGKGNNFFGGDDIYLEQYLHPERDIIPKQPLRPTQVKDMPNMEFRHVPQAPSGDPNLDGLGNFRATKAKDYNSIYDIWDFNTNANLFAHEQPYGAFGSKIDEVKNYVAKKILQNAGTPYAVYERYPKDYESDIWDEHAGGKEIPHAQPPVGYADYVEPPFPSNKVKR